MQAENEERVYKITTELTNLRKKVRNGKTLYDFIFSLTEPNGKMNYKMTEYYVPFTDDTIVHYSDTTNRIELYEKIEGKICEEPMHVFSKESAKTNTEQEILEFLEQQINRKRMREIKK